MKKITLLLILLGTFQLTIAQDRATEIRNQLMNRDESSVLVVAHRGDWRNAPENSLAAIENAIQMGVDIVEIDLQRILDGALIVMHDSRLDRTTTGQGKIAEWPLDSIRTLRLKNGCNIRTKHTVSTLEEAMLLCKGRILVNLDKAYDYFDEVYRILEQTGTTHQVIMKGSKPVEEVEKEFGNYLDKVIYMPVVNLDKEEASVQVQNFARTLNPVAYELVFADPANPLPLELAAALKGKSLIWYNTLWDTLAGGYGDDLALEDPDKSYGYLIRTLGARIIQTDRPAYLIKYLRSKNLHK
ncbi:MAG: glycerophosphodiester phosphodiesterase family protein [Bacteroides sp.]|nr:glycerophosphodiester phosphodiesterase family protein [Bacteroides sp.]